MASKIRLRKVAEQQQMDKSVLVSDLIGGNNLSWGHREKTCCCNANGINVKAKLQLSQCFLNYHQNPLLPN